MRILYVGTDDLLDWSRRMVLASAGYLLIDARERAQVGALVKEAQLVIISNLLPESDRNMLSTFLSSQHPKTLCMAFEASDSSHVHGEVLLHQLDPNQFLKRVGVALMKQHQHAEVKSKYFLYVDHRRRYIHVSDGVCEVLGSAGRRSWANPSSG